MTVINNTKMIDADKLLYDVMQVLKFPEEKETECKELDYFFYEARYQLIKNNSMKYLMDLVRVIIEHCREKED